MKITHQYIASLIGERRKDCHKGDNGKGLLLGGSAGLSGAAVMAACAALRGGTGTLKVLCPEGVTDAFKVLPEAMVTSAGTSWEVCELEKIRLFISASSCIAIGPGMGKGGFEAVKAAAESKKPLVIDADGLNAIAEKQCFDILHKNIILTPHPGEMARLTGKAVAEIAAEPEKNAAEFAQKWGCTVLLKGAVSYIASPDGRLATNTAGNAGLAKGGSGDVLTGIILALLCQGLKPFDAACAGAYILGTSADNALDILKNRMLMARDVTEAIEYTLDAFGGKDGA